MSGFAGRGLLAIRDELYDKPQTMPDGSLYSIIRYQGQFSTKF